MAIEKTIILNVDTEKGQDNIDDLAQGIENLNEELSDTGDISKDSFHGVEQDAKKAEKGVKGLKGGFKGLGVAIKALGIGLVLKAFDILGDLMSENQRTLDFFNTTFNVLSIAFNDFTNFIFDNFGKVGKMFDKVFSIEGLKAFGKAVKDNIIERLKSSLEVIGYFAKSIKHLFKGEFDEAVESIKEAGKELVDVITGVDNSTDVITKAAKGVAEYGKNIYKAANNMTTLKNNALLAAAVNQGLIEKYDIMAEKLRQVRDNDLLDIDLRIQKNDELKEVLEKQEQAMLANADAIIAAAQAELSRNNNIENQVALQEALNEKLGVTAQIEGFRSEQEANRIALLKEKVEIEKEIKDKEIEDEEERNAKLKALDDKRIKDEKAASDKRKKIAELEAKAKNDALEATSNALAKAGEILGEATTAGKAAGVASALISTYQGIANVWAEKSETGLVGAGLIQRIATTAVVAAQGFATVKKILSVKVPKGGSVSGGAVPSVSSAVPQVTPQYNVVGQTTGNQIADSLSEQPIQAYVVSENVTTQQELDRQIETTATF